MRDSAVEALIAWLRIRMWVKNILQSLVISMLAAALLVLILSISAHFTVIVDTFSKTAAILATACIAGTVIGAARLPKIKQAARVGDRLGLQDRLTTYLEYKDRGGSVIEAFKQELEDALFQFEARSMYKINFYSKQLLAVFIILGLSACLFLLPSLNREEARARETVNRELKQEAEKVLALKNALETPNASKGDPTGLMTEEQARAKLEELESSLNKSYSYPEAALQVADGLQELESLGQGIAGEDIKGLAGIFDGGGEKLEKSAALLRQGDAQGAAGLLENAKLGEKERQLMLENTRRMLEKGGYTESGKAVLESLQAGLEQDSFNPQKLSQIISDAYDRHEAGQDMQQIKNKLENMKERMVARSNEGIKSPGGAYQASKLDEGENDGRGNGEAADREAVSVAQGEYGLHAARNPDALGGGVAGSGGREEADREGQVAKSDQALLAGSPDTGGPVQELRGKWQEGDGRIMERVSDRVIGLEGDKGGYRNMYGEFQNEDMKYVDKSEIPAGKQQLVLKYFRSLEGGE